MVFDIEKAMEDRAKIKERKSERREPVIESSKEKDEEKTYGILFAIKDGESVPDNEKGSSPEQAFFQANQRMLRLGKKIDLEKCIVKDFQTGELFNHHGEKID